MTATSRREITNLGVVALTRALVDIPSVTGFEGPVMEYLESYLGRSGWPCQRQPVEGGRFNLWCAHQQHPRVILSTHLDTVPPHFPSREDSHFVYGRGSCDAKGIAAAMICAARSLAPEEFSAVALLFLVGEETDSAGARAATRSGIRADFLINGEPTGNCLVTEHKGVVWGRITTHGETAHSAYPERGVSAIDRMVELLSQLKDLAWPTDPELGASHFNVGRIAGGEAPNVVAGRAEAEFLIRTVVPSHRYGSLLEAAVEGRGAIEFLRITEPQKMLDVPGFPSRVVGFSTDIPALRPIARPLLIGPGSILDAHTGDERIAKQELTAGVSIYRKLARTLLQRDPQRLFKEETC